MALSLRIHKLLSGVVLLGLLLIPVQLLVSGGQPAMAQVAPADMGRETSALPALQLFRIRVTVRNPADWARLEKLGVVLKGARHGYTDEAWGIRASVPESVSVLAGDALWMAVIGTSPHSLRLSTSLRAGIGRKQMSPFVDSKAETTGGVR